MDNSRYEAAVLDVRLRQSFLDGLTRLEPLIGVSKVIYSAENYFGNVMRTRRHRHAFMGVRGTSSDIIVYDKAFTKEQHRDVVEFSSTLFDLHGYQARRTFEDPTATGLDFFDILKAIFIGSYFPPLAGEVSKKVDERTKDKEIHGFCTSLYHLIRAQQRGIEGEYTDKIKKELEGKIEGLNINPLQLADLYTRKMLELNAHKR